MPGTTKTKRTKATGANSQRSRLSFGRAESSSSPTRRRPTAPRSTDKPRARPAKASGMLEQARATLPGRKPAPSSRGGLTEAVRSTFSRQRSSSPSRSRARSKPALTGMVAGAAGVGVGVATLAARRRNTKQSDDVSGLT